MFQKQTDCFQLLYFLQNVLLYLQNHSPIPLIPHPLQYKLNIYDNINTTNSAITVPSLSLQ